jgi:uncharacterized protein (TIGR02145 family)
MPDGKIWFAQNLNYTQGLTYNAYSSEANGKPFTSLENGAPAIGSYWCPGVSVSTYSGDQNTCNIYGALYTWETAMMVDGKYADETKTSSAWDEKWVSANYFLSGTYAISPNAEKNNARGATNVHGGGRGICPLGWHVPTILEYAKMLDAVSESSSYTLSTPLSRTGIDDVARKLKIATLPPDKLAWSDAKTYPNHDTYGFSLAAAGERNPWYGDMRGLAMYTWVVSSTVQSSNDCHNMNSVYYTYQNGRYGVTIYTHLRSGSYSIRCIKD